MIWNSNACPVQKYRQSSSKFIESLKKFDVATKKEIARVNKLIEEKFPGIGLIKVSMDVHGVKKIHNNLELKVAEVE